jgi:hypothetical protein
VGAGKKGVAPTTPFLELGTSNLKLSKLDSDGGSSMDPSQNRIVQFTLSIMTPRALAVEATKSCTSFCSSQPALAC